MKLHELLTEAVALERKATKGPWESEHPDIYGDMADGSPGVLLYEDWEATEEDSALIVALRNLLVPLAAYVGELEEALRFYADEDATPHGDASIYEILNGDHWMAEQTGEEPKPRILRDKGEIARSALLLRFKEVPDAES